MQALVAGGNKVVHPDQSNTITIKTSVETKSKGVIVDLMALSLNDDEKALNGAQSLFYYGTGLFQGKEYGQKCDSMDGCMSMSDFTADSGVREIKVNTKKIPTSNFKILFLLTIFEVKGEKNKTFSDVKSIKVNIVGDENSNVVFEDNIIEYKNANSLQLIELYWYNNTLKVRVLNQGYSENINGVLKSHNVI